jgi:hypothetical protein
MEIQRVVELYRVESESRAGLGATGLHRKKLYHRGLCLCYAPDEDS